MVMIRATFWGFALFGLITLTIPTAVHYWLLMILGTLSLIALCVLSVLIFFDYLEVRHWRQRGVDEENPY